MDDEIVSPNEGTVESRSMSSFNGIEWPDYVVIGFYFLSVLAVGIYVSINILYSLR